MNKSSLSAPARVSTVRSTTNATPRKRASRATVEFAARKPVKIPESLQLLPEHCPNSAPHRVTFEYFNPTAREVFVAGTFNAWQPGATPLTKQRGGKWSAELLLKPGHYEYRLVVDGQWQDDPMAARFVANPFGGLNCLREVRPD